MGNELTEYGTFIKDIKELIYRRQYEAMKSVNSELIHLYWEIGEEIDRQQREQGWGNSVVEILAKELQREFPGVKGFSARNLWLMRNFYLEYAYATNLQPLVAEISWTKNIIIMQKCKDSSMREFYIKMTKRYGWTKDVLINNIENKAFEKYLTNQTNFDDTVPEKYRLQAKLAVKDDYNFDFIEMGIEHSEAELEAGVISNIRTFLAEMGGDFCFMGSQYHLAVDGEDYYLDLLLFHRRLKSLIVIELKIGEFKPEYVGKMQFYLTALDETEKLPGENPSIGIIICKNKSRTTVEYTLKSANKPIGVATYSYYDNLPENVRSLLPSPDEIARIVTEIEMVK
ncbi:MAG: PDDEXK nuclease domain-containing protein [Clostridiales Family XIII bacterium]|jgi:predicted nuclease of restriction endonuclease-like (RecB) superfamily|nr:PDDEXK nuclease domain-containing protein [Clostridiales Family XIII bacterium]